MAVDDRIAHGIANERAAHAILSTLKVILAFVRHAKTVGEVEAFVERLIEGVPEV